jgi:hypothetical protein
LVLKRIRKAGREGFEFGPAEAQAQVAAAATPPKPVTSPNLPPNLPPSFLPIFNKMRAEILKALPEVENTVGVSREDALVHALADAASALQLERATRFIFGSQLRALQILSDRAERRAPLTELQPIYAAAASASPAIFQTFSYESWLQYLINGHLIEVSGTDAVLTAEGQAAIPYMATRGYSIALPY